MSKEILNQTAFALRFRKAVESDVAFAKTMVRQDLPDSWRFFIEPNASFDGNPLVDDETLYPNDSLTAGALLGPLTFEQALSWLWRDGKVPEWVDVSVCAADAVHTYIRLICCGRFTGLEKRLYYRDGRPPFGLKSPDLPRGWESVEANGQFDLPALSVALNSRKPPDTTGCSKRALIIRVLTRWPLLWAASIPAVLVCIAQYLASSGRLIMSNDIGPRSFMYLGGLWYLTALVPVWLATHSKHRTIFITIAAVVPPSIGLMMFFFFGQLAPSQEEFETNARSFHFLLLIIAVIGACVAFVYWLLTHKKQDMEPS